MKSGLSKADTIQLAGIVAINYCRGPQIPFRLGRPHLKRKESNRVTRLPDPRISVKALTKLFAEMGLNEKDMLVLTTGSHTMGHVTMVIDYEKYWLIVFDII